LLQKVFFVACCAVESFQNKSLYLKIDATENAWNFVNSTFYNLNFNIDIESFFQQATKNQ
jgi:DNA-dependent RNA polymerase auxiliary subunit epsilon